MSKLDKATDLYLRGFTSQYIKRRTGISIQSLLNQQRALGNKYTEQDIVEYQIAYIRRKFSEAEIESAYRDLRSGIISRDATVLGCCLRNYVPVFRVLLGVEKFQTGGLAAKQTGHTVDRRTGSPEDVMYELLAERFGPDDVKRNILVDSRYPYHVSFYVQSRDLFIEFLGGRAHNGHWFDAKSFRDSQTLHAWIENLCRDEYETGKASKYRKYVKTWAETDIAKRDAAKRAGLNYLVFWDGSYEMRNKRQIPYLTDFYAWLSDDCPMPRQWRPENMY